MSTNEQQQQQQQYDEQLPILKESFPQAHEGKLILVLRRHDGDVDKVRARLTHREFRRNKWDSLETRFGPTLTALQQENPSSQPFRRMRLLKMMERYDGDVEQVRKGLQNVEERHHGEGRNCGRFRHHGEGRNWGKCGHHGEGRNWDKCGHHGEGRNWGKCGHHGEGRNWGKCGHHGEGRNCGRSRHEQREELKAKYATQLAELATAGINVNSPCTLRLLEKNQGDVAKVIEIKSRRSAKKERFGTLDTKYASQIAQLEADGVQIKNKRILARLLEKADGQIDVVKQLINERQEKHLKRKEYQHKHRATSPQEGDETISTWKRRREFSADDLDTLKQLRSAGAYGHPKRVLAAFHECNGSIEMTLARIQTEREERVRHRDERVLKRTLLAESDNAYITLNNREDWPRDIEQVYLDGNNMMFVVNSLRRLCLNHAGEKTEHAIGEIASAWNEQMHISNIELIFDSTRQLDQIGTVKVTSAQPKYKTTDDMLVDIARRPENHEKNKRTIVITSDRALAVLLQREGCLLMKPYNWFAHCVMVLTPDLINYEEITGMMTTASSPTTVKIRYNFDELVHRIANIDI